MSRVLKNKLGGLVAGLSLALSLALAAPPASAAAAECTHSSVTKWYGLTVVTYKYVSGRWRYVGSQLMHQHYGTKLTQTIPVYDAKLTEFNYYCAS